MAENRLTNYGATGWAYSLDSGNNWISKTVGTTGEVIPDGSYKVGQIQVKNTNGDLDSEITKNLMQKILIQQMPQITLGGSNPFIWNVEPNLLNLAILKCQIRMIHIIQHFLLILI